MARNDDKITHVPFAERTAEKREKIAEAQAVNWLLGHLARQLPAGSATAAAIRRGEGWEDILRIARWEDVEEVSGLLLEALDFLGDDLPPAMTGRRPPLH